MTGSGCPKWRRDKTGWRLELQTACRHHTLKEHLAPEVSLQLQPMGFKGHFYGPTSTTRGYIKTQTSKGKHHQLRWTEIKQTCYFVSCHLLHHHLSLSLSQSPISCSICLMLRRKNWICIHSTHLVEIMPSKIPTSLICCCCIKETSNESNAPKRRTEIM